MRDDASIVPYRWGFGAWRVVEGSPRRDEGIAPYRYISPRYFQHSDGRRVRPYGREGVSVLGRSIILMQFRL